MEKYRVRITIKAYQAFCYYVEFVDCTLATLNKPKDQPLRSSPLRCLPETSSSLP